MPQGRVSPKSRKPIVHRTSKRGRLRLKLPASGRVVFVASAVLVRRVKGRIVIQAMIPPGGGLGGGLDNPNHGCRTVVHSSGKQQVELYGSAGASVGTSGVSTIAVSWDGSFEYCAGKSTMGQSGDCSSIQTVAQAECESKNHQLILTRR